MTGQFGEVVGAGEGSDTAQLPGAIGKFVGLACS